LPKGFTKITLPEGLKDQLKSVADAEGLGMPDLIRKMLGDLECDEKPFPEGTEEKEEKPHVAHKHTSIECGSKSINIGSTRGGKPNLYLIDNRWPVGTSIPIFNLENKGDFDNLWQFIYGRATPFSKEA